MNPRTKLLTFVAGPALELVGANPLQVKAEELYRYELIGGDLLYIYSPDDTVFFSPERFSSKGYASIPIPAGTPMILRISKSWKYLYLMRENTEGTVYVAEWKFERE